MSHATTLDQIEGQARPGRLATFAFAAIVGFGLVYTGSQLFQDLVGVQTASVAPFALLGMALIIALGFEFVNGFHDTANAVATVIYTHSLTPTVAVVWSGMWNLIGVLTSSGAVAFGILALLPVELVLNVGSAAGFAMVFALLVSAIAWNLGTWYFGLPASSSHTLIGSILGVGLMNSFLSSQRQFGDGVNWAKTYEVGMSLLISPVVGFVCAALLLLLAKALIRKPELYQAPEGRKAPPLWIRSLLVLTCTGVSFAHGSNDGQKGMGLIMLILIGVVPGVYAINRAVDHDQLQTLLASSRQVQTIIETTGRAHMVAATDPGLVLSSYLRTHTVTEQTVPALWDANRNITAIIGSVDSLSSFNGQVLSDLRSSVYVVSETLGRLVGTDMFRAEDRPVLRAYRDQLRGLTNFIPTWVKIAVALALGFGTMVGWKRIVVTVGEKIGKSHLTYAQGASAELVAMTTIGAADMLGLPVSTTHVLSSGVAGTMAANHSGLQTSTLRNLLLAWVLTLPVCVFLGAMLFAAGLNLVFFLGGA